MIPDCWCRTKSKPKRKARGTHYRASMPHQIKKVIKKKNRTRMHEGQEYCIACHRGVTVHSEEKQKREKMRRTSPKTERWQGNRKIFSNILIFVDNPDLLAGPHLSGPTPCTLSLSSEMDTHLYHFPLSLSVVLSKGTSRENRVTL